MLSYSTYVLAALGYALTTMFLAIYLLADPRHAKSAVFAVMPRNHHVKLARILKQLSVIVGGYMRGQLITSVAIGVFMFATMSALRVDDALAIAVFAALTDIIPFVGGYLASGPAVLAVAARRRSSSSSR
jgi:predicted PurR-regulated permease PerM